MPVYSCAFMNHRVLRSFLFGLVLAAVPRIVLAQAAPTAAPPPPPPPEREGSAEFAYVATGCNASTQTIVLGGELIFRPAPWETRLKVAYVRNKSEEELKSESFLLVF